MSLFTHQYYSSKFSSENAHHSPGLFDECLSHRTDSPNFHGQYCTVFVDVEFIAHSNDDYDTNNPRDFLNGNRESKIKMKKSIQHYYLLNTLPSIGFCLPSSCSAADLQTAIARQLSSRTKENDKDNNTLIVVTDDNFCYTREKINAVKIDWSDYIMMYSSLKNE